MKEFFKSLWTAILILILSGIYGCYSYRPVAYQYAGPEWASPYDDGVRYYYLPDIEAYYDLSNNNFVYLDNGHWVFSVNPPTIYAGFDLYNSFYISLNFNVFQPWMHHQHYLFHYPRYYYKNKYSHDFGNIRGYNENKKAPVYWRNDERDRINNLKKRGVPFQNNEPKLDAQKPNYQGKEIGRPVRVRPNMKESPKPQRIPTPNKPGQSRGPR